LQELSGGLKQKKLNKKILLEEGGEKLEVCQ